MTKHDDGGAAFPSYESVSDGSVWVMVPRSEGMSLRDYFAAKAMQGGTFADARAKGATRDEAASECVADADALLMALAAHTQPGQGERGG